jgi:hypothetical protein
VALVTTTYQTGVTLTKDAMETVEAHLQRLPVLGACPRNKLLGLSDHRCRTGEVRR